MLCTCSPFVASSFIPLFLTHEIVDWWKTTGVCERLMLLRGNQGLCEELLRAAESTIQPGACRCLSSSPLPPAQACGSSVSACKEQRLALTAEKSGD